MESRKEEQCLQHGLRLISLHREEHKTHMERPTVITVSMKDAEHLYKVFREPCIQRETHDKYNIWYS